MRVDLGLLIGRLQDRELLRVLNGPAYQALESAGVNGPLVGQGLVCLGPPEQGLSRGWEERVCGGMGDVPCSFARL